ncbi:MAG: C-terminal binding protein [Chloroflexi bacterium]|nr:C-terminal binding protein [Chloroflexota bacterium]
MPFKVVGKGMGGPLVEGPLAKAGVRFETAPMQTEDDIIRYAGDADAVFAGATELYSARVMDNLTRCRVISRAGVGYDNIDVAAATERGIAVAYTPGASVPEVSDHAMALLLALARRIVPIARLARTAPWSQTQPDLVKLRRGTPRLSTQTLGIFGSGRIGAAVIGKARAFGLRVLVYDPYADAQALRRLGAELVDLDQLLSESDFITLHAPATPETRQSFNLERFRKMKRTASIINTARGALIKEDDLVTALKEGAIAGAAIDVTDPEPPALDNPLRQMDNVILTMHSAFFSETSMEETRHQAVEAVLLALQGAWPPTLVNPEVKQSPNRRIP